MKKEILDALKAKFQGVSDIILNRIADKMAKTVTKQEDVATTVEGVTFQQVLESYGDSRATEAQQTAVTNYEKKHGLKDGAKADEQGGDGKKPEEPKKKEAEEKKPEQKEDVPAWAQTLINSNQALEKRLASIEGEKTANSRKSSLAKILENAPEKIRTRYEKDFARMNFKDEDDFNEWVNEITPDIESISTEFVAKGAVVGRPKGGMGKGTKEGEISPHLKARIAEKEAEQSAPAIVGLATQTNPK